MIGRCKAWCTQAKQFHHIHKKGKAIFKNKAIDLYINKFVLFFVFLSDVVLFNYLIFKSRTRDLKKKIIQFYISFVINIMINNIYFDIKIIICSRSKHKTSNTTKTTFTLLPAFLLTLLTHKIT